MKSLLILIACLLSPASLLANDSPEALQEAFMTALRAQDTAGLAACYAEDATSYDVGTQVLTGGQAVAASWGGFFSSYNLLDANLFDTHIETHGDTGIAWGQFKLLVEPVAGGDSFEMVGRFTDISRNIDGSWVYILDHVSMVPPATEE